MSIEKWKFCIVAKQSIIELSNKDTYKKYGDFIIDSLILTCSENFDIVRYPSSKEIEQAIDYAIRCENMY